ncbi:hypothetical protein HH310_01260 [Actinoplanes sp. TBRC 11911]|uniref:hypothetical protein n=1 Tax=Actinoplanes sp. TBRC 11911 TaxID=2729386 RepID=UPI00145DFA4A|nr:hypothetical protein [Actinoplanes sp. TBRC 11911]NMO49829.1 hypothetical protein [Actinoplanes sp. TBRC 11911]
MLTDGDRARLAPYLAKMRSARAALAAAVRTAAETQTRVTEIKRSSTLWERWFNRDSATGAAFREAREIAAEARVAVKAREDDVRDLDRRFDNLLESLMPRIDPRYEARARLIESCAHAARECQAMRHPIGLLASTARAAAQNGDDAEAARYRYPDRLVEARKAVRAVQLALEAVAPRPQWNDAVLDRLPKTVGDVTAIRRLNGELPKVTQLPGRLDRLRAELTKRQRDTEHAQLSARYKARDRLVNRPD